MLVVAEANLLVTAEASGEVGDGNNSDVDEGVNGLKE